MRFLLLGNLEVSGEWGGRGVVLWKEFEIV